MAKRSKSATKYKSFHLHGNHTTQKVFVLIVLDFAFAISVGLHVIGPYVASLSA